MPTLARKPAWHKQLRQSNAIHALRAARPDDFPLQEVQDLMKQLLSSSSLLSLGKRDAPPRSQPANRLLLAGLGELKNELYTYEAAVVGCVHLLTYNMARGHLCSKIRPDLATAGADPIFSSRISVYLQCIILAQRGDAQLVHGAEAAAARELLSLLHHKRSRKFPAAVKMLATLADNDCEGLLPLDFVKATLARARYRDALSARLDALRKSREWVEAYRLVSGLQGLSRRSDLPQSIRPLLPEIFARYPMWAQWRPNLERIGAWESKITAGQRAQLGRVFDLEGPDTTSQQRAVLRFSSDGAFAGCRATPGSQRDTDILDQLLDTLDQAVAVGPSAVDLFIRLCLGTTAHNRPLTWHPLVHMEAGLSLLCDAAARTLSEFLRVLEPRTGVRDRMKTFTAALGLMRSSARLQDTFGLSVDLAVHGPRVLADAQAHFCALLQAGRPALDFGLEVRALGVALSGAAWLRERWKPAFTDMLAALPSPEEIRARFAAMRAAQAQGAAALVLAHMDYLAATLGGSDVAGQHQQQGDGQPVPGPPPVVIEDAIWHAALDVDRDKLRGALRLVYGSDLALATACLRAAQDEYDSFVRDVAAVLARDSDQACVNLARLLGRRAQAMLSSTGGGSRPLAECWRTLLLQVMRQRPVGMLERLGAELGAQSWKAWIENLRRLFGERHLGPEGRLGFTADKIRRISRRKMGVERLHPSTSTSSTLSL